MAERRRLLLFPFGGNAREALPALLADDGPWLVEGFIDDDMATWGKQCCGVKVLGGRKVAMEMADTLVLAVPGSPDTYHRRKKVIDGLGLPLERFSTVIHPSAVIGPCAKVGRNTLIMPHVVVSPEAEVGNHCVILPNTVIAHGSIIGEYTLIGSNVTVSGNVSIGKNCYIGSGVNIRDHVSIGPGCLVGLGANVVSDLGRGVVAVGNPAKAMRKAPT